MTKKSQTHSDGFDPAKMQETIEAFTALWQQHWQEMMHQNGWPSDMAAPSMNPMHMPFMFPFMGGFTPPSDQTRIDALEARIAALEAQLTEKSNKATQKKTATHTHAGATRKKTARKKPKA